MWDFKNAASLALTLPQSVHQWAKIFASFFQKEALSFCDLVTI
jgi:hypothetical protein